MLFSFIKNDLMIFLKRNNIGIISEKYISLPTVYVKFTNNHFKNKFLLFLSV